VLREEYSARLEFRIKDKILNTEDIEGIRRASIEEHAVAIGVEAVTLGDGVGIGAEDVFASGEGTDEHEQGGLREVEVGEECFDGFEIEGRAFGRWMFGGWVDEEVGGGGTCGDGSGAEADGVFEGADRSSADGNDAARGAKSVVDGGRGGGGDGIGLGVEFVVFDAVDADRLEGSQADVEGNLGGFDAALADAVEDGGSEVEAGRGSGDRSGGLGIDGLITLAVGGGIGAGDVGWERNVADAIEESEEIVWIGVVRSVERLEADAALSEFGAGEDLGLQIIVLSEEEAFADADLAAGANQALPIVGVGGELAGQENFDASVKKVAGGGIARADGLSVGAFAATVETGGKDAGVVEDEQIAGVKQVGEVAELAVGITAGALQVEHAGSVALGEGLLGDEVGG
jgi:hypothetical protein